MTASESEGEEEELPIYVAVRNVLTPVLDLECQWKATELTARVRKKVREAVAKIDPESHSQEQQLTNFVNNVLDRLSARYASRAWIPQVDWMPVFMAGGRKKFADTDQIKATVEKAMDDWFRYHDWATAPAMAAKLAREPGMPVKLPRDIGPTTRDFAPPPPPTRPLHGIGETVPPPPPIQKQRTSAQGWLGAEVAEPCPPPPISKLPPDARQQLDAEAPRANQVNHPAAPQDRLPRKPPAESPVILSAASAANANAAAPTSVPQAQESTQDLQGKTPTRNMPEQQPGKTKTNKMPKRFSPVAVEAALDNMAVASASPPPPGSPHRVDQAGEVPPAAGTPLSPPAPPPQHLPKMQPSPPHARQVDTAAPPPPGRPPSQVVEVPSMPPSVATTPAADRSMRDVDRGNSRMLASSSDEGDPIETELPANIAATEASVEEMPPEMPVICQAPVSCQAPSTQSVMHTSQTSERTRSEASEDSAAKDAHSPAQIDPNYPTLATTSPVNETWHRCLFEDDLDSTTQRESAVPTQNHPASRAAAWSQSQRESASAYAPFHEWRRYFDKSWWKTEKGSIEINMQGYRMDDAVMSAWCRWAQRELPRMGATPSSPKQRARHALGLNFSDNLITDAGIEELVEFLINGVPGVRLLQLRLHKNRLGEAAANSIARLIGGLGKDFGPRDRAALEELHLSHNKLGKQGIIRILHSVAAAWIEHAETPLYPLKISPGRFKPLWLRVEYNGQESTAPQDFIDQVSTSLREKRQQKGWLRQGDDTTKMLCLGRTQNSRCTVMFCESQQDQAGPLAHISCWNPNACERRHDRAMPGQQPWIVQGKQANTVTAFDKTGNVTPLVPSQEDEQPFSEGASSLPSSVQV